jgi:hypothetical protein
MPVSFLKKFWKNSTDSPPAVVGTDPEMQATEFNRFEKGIDDTATLANAVEAAIAAHLADTTDAHDASAISLADVANHFAAGDVEAAIAELFGMSGGAVFTGGTISGPTTVQISDPNAVPLQILQPQGETAYPLLIIGNIADTLNTERRWAMFHPEGGMCLSSAYEPNWAILHLYKWGAGQSKPILRITNELAAGPDDLFIVDQNGGLIITPAVDIVDPVRIFDYLGHLLFEIKRDGEIVGAPPIVDAMVLLNPKAAVGTWNRNVQNLFRFPYYVWNGNPGDHIDFDVGLFAGSWYLDVYVVGGNDQGVATAQLDGVNFGAGTVTATDPGATPVDKMVTLGPVTVTTAGRKTLRFVNASGNFGIRHAVFRRA